VISNEFASNVILTLYIGKFTNPPY